MKFYVVGGFLRDFFLGLEPKDKDYVIVDPDFNILKEEGFSQIGKFFPVFIKDGHDYAVARSESLINGKFKAKEAGLIEDLKRRDFTINSIALDEESGELIDPFEGLKDLENKILRHTSLAFKEDPLRVLRGCRIASKLNFKIHDETLKEMKRIASTPEYTLICPERILSELKRSNIPKFIRLLDSVNGLSILKIKDEDFKSSDYNTFILELSKFPYFHDFIEKFSIEKHLVDSSKILKNINLNSVDGIYSFIKRTKALSTDKKSLFLLNFLNRKDLLPIISKLKKIKIDGEEGMAIGQKLDLARKKIIERECFGWKLFLDDIRDVSYLKIKKDEKQLTNYSEEGWVICRDVKEAMEEIKIRESLPYFISFDHDLGLNGDEIKKPSGFDFVKIITELVLDEKYELPDNFSFQVHSDNPIGKKNIETYLKNFIKHTRSGK